MNEKRTASQPTFGNKKAQFCSYCGTRLDDGARFCKNCGEAVSGDTQDFREEKRGEPLTGNPTERKTVYEGYIHKCPNCGENLGAFTAHCPSCGYEIRGAETAKAIREFAVKLENLQSDEEKISFIRNFPIPNSKEDIYEFMILASTNIVEALDPNVSAAWAVKVEQCFQKAQMIFTSETDLAYIQKSYNECHQKLKTAHKRDINKTVSKTISKIIIKNIAVIIGLILVLAGVIVDNAGGDSVMVELIAYVVLIASACTIRKRNSSISDYGIGLLSGMITIALSFMLENGSAALLSGIIVIGVIAVSYFRQICNNSQSASSSNKQSDNNLVKVPFSIISGNYENYSVVEILFIQAGFTNVRTVPLNDLTLGLLKKSGEVESITINGKKLSTYFKRTFNADAAVLITYHSMRS